MPLVSHALLPIGKLASQLSQSLARAQRVPESHWSRAEIGVRMLYGPLSETVVIGRGSMQSHKYGKVHQQRPAKAQLSNKLWTAAAELGENWFNNCAPLKCLNGILPRCSSQNEKAKTQLINSLSPRRFRFRDALGLGHSLGPDFENPSNAAWMPMP